MSDDTQTETSNGEAWSSALDEAAPEATALVIAWSVAEPHRLGEVAIFPQDGALRVLGRGSAPEGDKRMRVAFERQRPASREVGAPLASRKISREQLLLTPVAGRLRVESVGRCPMFVNGQPSEQASLRPGDTLLLQHQLLLICVRRPAQLPAAHWPRRATWHRFGARDDNGLVGESAAIWALRDAIAFAAARDEHLLVLGPSGSGKELAARGVHHTSKRASGPWVAHNAANFPEALVDAELFGNCANYPNPGMLERPGLVGAADGGTLFLDEIGELPQALQAHLLRVMDSGEYQRLGDASARKSDLRLVAATNRDVRELRHDLVGRFPLRVSLPALEARREDIPLILRSLLEQLRQDDERVAARFFQPIEGEDGFRARVDPALVDGLLRHDYVRHVRELRGLALRAMASSPGDFIALSDEVSAELDGVEPPPVDPRSLTKEAIVAALDRCGGNQSAAYKALNLRSRDALYRLIKKHGLTVRKA